MRVEFLVEQLCARVPGGTGRYTRELLRALHQASPAHPLRARVGRPCPASAELSEQGVPVATIGLPGPVLARLWERGLPPRLGGLPGRGIADVVHAPTLLAPPVHRASALVVTVHDVVPWTHPETLTPRGAAFHQRMGARVAAGADLIIVPTEAVAGQVRTLLRPCCPVVAIPLGATPLTVPPDARAHRARLGLTDRRYVLFVGTAEPRKGLDILINAMRDPAVADLDLVVVGATGWGEVDLHALTASAGLTDRVHLLGRVSDAELAAVQAGAAVLAMPSRAEGFGIPVIEAMSLGVPVVTSDDPALLETGAGHALVAPIGDAPALALALAEAAAPGAPRDARVTAGQGHASSLTWDRAARATWAAYAVARDGIPTPPAELRAPSP